MNFIEALILAIVEGITEFLPISSTGHMIIASSMMGINENAFTKVFEVNIQFGAILSVVILYWKRFFNSLDFYFKLFVAFIPAAIIGFVLGDFIDSLLENVLVVAVSLLVGGIILIFVDQWFAEAKKKPTINHSNDTPLDEVFIEQKNTDQEVSYSKALNVGFFQCIAMVPGVSRSAASIIGGMLQGWSRKQAAEFSFFLAVPTMFAASAYKLLKDFDKIKPDDLTVLLFGNLVAFVVAMLAIKFFISFLTKYGFKAFGYYRIILGLLIIVLLSMGYELKI